jgi:hypothetical protein
VIYISRSTAALKAKRRINNNNNNNSTNYKIKLIEENILGFYYLNKQSIEELTAI